MRPRIKISRRRLYARVELFENGALAATTTLDRDVTRESPQVREFIRKHQHRPKEKAE